MSVVVGIEHQGTVYMGADSGGWRNGFEDASSTSKLIRVGPLLIGCTGDLRAQNVLEHWVDDLPELGDSVERYLIRELIPRIRDASVAQGCVKKFDECEGADGWGGHLLIGARDELWLLSGAYCVFRNTRGYAAVGADSGAGIALGVLYATASLEPWQRISQALAAAEEHTDVCRRPFHFETLSGATYGIRMAFGAGAVR